MRGRLALGVLGFLMLVATPARAAAADVGDAELRALLREHVAHDTQERERMLRYLDAEEVEDARTDAKAWSGLGLESPYGRILRAAHERATPGHVTKALQTTYGLPAPAARALLAGQLLARPVVRPRGQKAEEQSRRALEVSVAAARQAPDSLTVLGALLLSDALREAPGFEEAFSSVLDGTPDLPRMALQLAKAGHTAYLGDWSVSLAALAVSRQPEALPAAIEALGLEGGGGAVVLFQLAAFRRLQATGTPGAELAERLLRNLLHEGLPDLAMETLRALPQEQRTALREARWSVHEYQERMGRGGAARQEVPPEDVRPSLAAAFLATGDRSEATAWLVAARTGAAESSGPEACAATLQREVLARHLEARAGDDPYPLLVRDSECSGGGEHPWDVLMAELLKVRFAEYARASLDWELSYLARREGQTYRELPLQARLTFLQPAQQAVAAAQKARRERLEHALAAMGPQAETARPRDPAAARIQERLAAPAPTLFRERALSSLRAPATRGGWRAVDPKSLRIPEGFWPVRAERREKEAVVLALSHRLDPAGEVSGGAYWLLESKDAGEHWGMPLYLGLRQYRPYELAEQSRFPLRDGDTLRVEGAHKELDENTITFPPVGLQVKRKGGPVLLEASLAALRQDADGDGLTDLVEARLLLDPGAADSDGDGLPDGRDPVPHVARREAAPDARAELVSAVLFELQGGRHMQEAAVEGVQEESGDGGRHLPEMRAPDSLEHVTFLVADRSLMAGLQPEGTLVVLSAEEVTAASARFGAFYPRRIELFLNAAGDEAFIRWSDGWRGGSFTAKRKDGAWTLESHGQWIT